MKKIFNYLPCLIEIILCMCLISCNHTQGNGQIPPSNVIFPINKNVVEIPFTRYRGWIIIKLTINNSKILSFILDTGAPIAILSNESLKDKINLHFIGNAIVNGSDPNKSKSVPLASAVKFKIGDIIIENCLMAIGAGKEVIGGVDGIIGKYLFDKLIVKIKWDENVLELSKAETFNYAGNGESIPIQLLPSGHIYSDIMVEKNNKSLIVRSDIDLGNRSTFFIDNEKGGSLIKNEKVIPNIIISWGINGPSYGNLTRANLKIGNLLIKNVLTGFNEFNPQVKREGIQANIGLSILEKFIPIFDYQHKKLILEKNSNAKQLFEYNKSGIILDPKMQDQYYIIADIIPSSPASEIDLKTGDRIISINDLKQTELSIDMIENLFLGISGDTLKISIERKGKRFLQILKLREII